MPFSFVFGVEPRSGLTAGALDDERADSVEAAYASRCERLAREVQCAQKLLSKQQDKVKDRRSRLPSRSFPVNSLVFVYMPDLGVKSRKLQSPWQGPFRILPRQPDDHPPLYRVLTHRQDAAHGVAIHQDRLKAFVPDVDRQWVDPTPDGLDSWHELEDGSKPDISSFGLSDDDIEAIALVCNNSQPLRPSVFDVRSDHCTICRQKLLKKAVKQGLSVNVNCAFCNGFTHSECAFNGDKRSAVNRPAIYRCAHCVMELPKALQAAREIHAARARALLSASGAVAKQVHQ